MTAVHHSTVSGTDDPAAPARSVLARVGSRRARFNPAERDLTRIDSLLELSTGLWPWLPGANVIIQLANPAVGYGVFESRGRIGAGGPAPDQAWSHDRAVPGGGDHR